MKLFRNQSFNVTEGNIGLHKHLTFKFLLKINSLKINHET